MMDYLEEPYYNSHKRRSRDLENTKHESHRDRKYSHKHHYRSKHKRSRDNYGDRDRAPKRKSPPEPVITGNLLGSVESDSCKYAEQVRDLNDSRDRDNHRQETETDLSEVLQADFEEAVEPQVEEEIGEFEEEEEEEEIEEYDENLPPFYPAIDGCRSLSEFQCLNRIAEGTYGVVYRFRDKRTQEIVALKKLKMENEKEGFPRTSLREINTLLKGQHANIVTVREIVVGSDMDKIFIVMDYIEHDLKSLIESMKLKNEHFAVAEVKCLLKQLLSAVAHLHDNWILHRDLKPANLLLSHNGVLKVGDFGLAREYGSPLKPYTSLVVTLWYRAPELLLGIKNYSTPIDVWSVGCIFAELLLMNALFPGKSEKEQINRIFKCLGTPSEKIWQGYNKLPAVQNIKLPSHQVSNLSKKFQMVSAGGLSFLLAFLTYDPAKRITAEEALAHPYFYEFPNAIDPSEFTKWPAKSETGHKRAAAEEEPRPPPGGGEKNTSDEEGFWMGLETEKNRKGAGFSLKF